MIQKNILIWLSVFIVGFTFSCQKDEITSSKLATVNFSTHKLNFDTVFSTIGSATKRLMVYNKNSKTIKIESVVLAGATNSAFKINVDGISGTEVKNIEIQPNDSAYIFVQVLVNPTNQNSPLVLNDSLIFTTNGNVQKVILEAWGQDVYLLRDTALNTQQLNTNKPYLVYGTCLVAEGQTLTIPKGVTIYFHNKSRLWVAGTIIAEGTLENPINLLSDRLDYVLPNQKYNKFGGQWDGVYLMPNSKGNILKYTNISNAVTGILLNHYNFNDTFRIYVNSKIWEKKYENPDTTSLELQNCKINTHSNAGIVAFNAIIKANNTIIANCNQFGLAVLLGGQYEFNHCTLVNYSKFRADGAVVYFSDSYKDALKRTFTGTIKNMYFGNCIVYGTNSNEVLYDIKNANLYFKFQNCLLKINTEKFPVDDSKKFDRNSIQDIHNPGFKSIDSSTYTYDFNITKDFVGKDKGNVEIGKLFPKDYNGTDRIKSATNYAPDCGAYEYTK